jgi:hypothetical protein
MIWASKWEKVVAGFAEGFGLQAEEKCVGSGAGDAEALDKAVEDLMKKTEAGVKDGLEELSEALKDLPGTYDGCKGTATADVQKLRDALKAIKPCGLFKMGPCAEIKGVGENLFVNGVDIYNEIKEAVTAYHAEQWEQFGKDIGAVLKLLSTPADIPKPSMPWDNKPWVQVLHGVLDGFGLEPEDSCFDHAVGDVVALYEAVEQIHTEDEGKVKDGLRTLAGALEDFPGTLATCKAGVADAQKEISRLKSAIVQMKSPSTFAVHIGHDLLVNGVDIYKEVKDAVTQYRGKHWSAFGEDLGKALSKLLVGVMVNAVSEEMHYRLVPAGGKLPVNACRNIAEGTYGDPVGTCEEHGYTFECMSCSQFANTYLVEAEGTCNQKTTECYFRNPDEKCVGTSVCPYKTELLV